MNEHQRTAYESPMIGDEHLEAELGTRPRTRTEKHHFITVTVLVTVEVATAEMKHLGYEAAWHVSVSCWPRRGAQEPLLVERWKRRHQIASMRAFEKNLEGVGDRSQQATLVPGSYSHHLYLPLSSDELAGLPSHG